MLERLDKQNEVSQSMQTIEPLETNYLQKENLTLKERQ